MASGAQVMPSDAQSSLLSLSVAAASAPRIPVSGESPAGSNPAFGHSNVGHGNILTNSKLHGSSKHRRFSSTGVMKRRLSDAREAATRPSPATIQSAAAALSSLATLSLSSSPPATGQLSTSFTAASETINSNPPNTSFPDTSVKQETVDTRVSHDTSNKGKGELSVGGITIKNGTGTGKKRGTIFKCESCSKVYRHPSCLIKHRWEHSPHWREASKFLLSKHQQVQLLEAAAILSHISPSASGGTSLPEDRSLWPSFLSGGTMPPPSTSAVSANGETAAKQGMRVISSLEVPQTFPTSSSVPSHITPSPHITRSTSTGPRMHDYSIPTTNGLTHVRPGVLAVPTASGSDTPVVDISEPPTSTRTVPVPVPISNTTYRDPTAAYSLTESWGSPVSYPYGHSYGTGGGWSLPNSSVRSGSDSASRSRSGSIPRSEYEEEFIDVDGDEVGDQTYAFISRGRTSATRGGWKDTPELGPAKGQHDKPSEEWDGMEMEMEM